MIFQYRHYPKEQVYLDDQLIVEYYSPNDERNTGECSISIIQEIRRGVELGKFPFPEHNLYWKMSYNDSDFLVTDIFQLINNKDKTTTEVNKFTTVKESLTIS
jgi:hypothetical protein